jgi:hypothetical protein
MNVPLTFAVDYYSFSDEERLQKLEEFAAAGGRHIVLTPAMLARMAASPGYKRELEKELAGLNITFADSHAPHGGQHDLHCLCEEERGDFTFSYGDELSIAEKIEAVVKKVYRGNGVNVLPAAKKQIAELEALGFGNCPICIAKTQYSFSDDPSLLGAPEGFTVTVKNVKISAGAGFIVVLTGDIMTMPGLPKVPAAERIDVDDNGKIVGLF